MALDELIPLLICAALLVGSIALFGWLSRRSERLVELQYAIYLAHRSSLVFAAIALLGVFAVNALLGIAFITKDRSLGWSFLLLAPVPLVFLAYLVYVAKLPFEPPSDSSTSEPAEADTLP